MSSSLRDIEESIVDAFEGFPVGTLVTLKGLKDPVYVVVGLAVPDSSFSETRLLTSGTLNLFYKFRSDELRRVGHVALV